VHFVPCRIIRMRCHFASWLVFLVARPVNAWHCAPWAKVDLPLGIAIDRDDSVFVASENGLQKCDGSGACKAMVIGACEDVAVDGQGALYLVTRKNFDSKAQRCSLAGQCAPIGGAEPWEWPVAVAADAAGHAFVVDAYHGLKKCTQDTCTNFTLHGSGSNSDIALDSEGVLYLVDRSRPHGIARCASTDMCEDLTGFEAFGWQKMQPYAIAIGSDGELYIGGEDTDGTTWLKMCSSSGECVDIGSAWGEIKSIAVDSTGALLISDGQSLHRCALALSV